MYWSSEPSHDCVALSQAALRLTNHQREAMVASYAVLAGRLSAARQAFEGAAAAPEQPQRDNNGASSANGSSNLVGLLSLRTRPSPCRMLS